MNIVYEEKNSVIEKDTNEPERSMDCSEELKLLVREGKYWQATEMLEKISKLNKKDERAGETKVFYDMDWEKFFEGMCCYSSADSCLSGVGGCSGCGSCLCGAYCVCYICTGERPAEGCDCMLDCWNNCFCIDFLCGDTRDCINRVCHCG